HVENYYLPDRMKDQRQSERENEERQLAEHECCQIPATRPRKRTLADGAGEDVAKSAVQMPTDRGDAVQQPQVDVLPAMPRSPRLPWRQASERTEVNVAVVAVDIDPGVVKAPMLPLPDVRTAADHIQRHRHQPVDPAVLRIGLVPTIVHDVETDP